jgi:dTDP-glucose 4,6-dehydratase
MTARTDPPFRPKAVLVTGGAGFIGSNLVRWLLAHEPALRVINYDLLTYAGNLESLEDVQRRHGAPGDGRYSFVHGDIRDFDRMAAALRTDDGVDAVLHLAAESHVDRSIMGPEVFVDTNVRGTLVLLEACRAELERRPRQFRFVHVSTDEVYGSLGPTDPAFTEATPLAPNNPYAATKASSDLLVRAYTETFGPNEDAPGLPAIVTRCSNNYGPYQFPEKLIPLMITRALQDQPLPVYGDGLNVRDWLYVEDHAEALWAVVQRARVGATYNIGGSSELPNLEVVRRLLAALGKPESLISFVRDRPGHDRRYAMDTTRIRAELGWRPRHDFAAGLDATVRWYLSHETWWRRVLSEAYRAAGTYLS